MTDYTKLIKIELKLLEAQRQNLIAELELNQSKYDYLSSGSYDLELAEKIYLEYARNRA